MKPKFKVGEWVYINDKKQTSIEFDSPLKKVQITDIKLEAKVFIYFFDKNFIDHRAYYEFRLVKIQQVNYLPDWF